MSDTLTIAIETQGRFCSDTCQYFCPTCLGPVCTLLKGARLGLDTDSGKRVRLGACLELFGGD
jgi:hypothetical protein